MRCPKAAAAYLALTAAMPLVAGCISSRPPKGVPPPMDLSAHPEPEVVGVTHRVKAGETLWRIARAYRVTVDDLSVANRLAPSATLKVGQELFVPGAKAVVEVPPAEGLPPAEASTARKGQARLAWPLKGVLYARFGPRGETRHDGIDIAAPLGTVVGAAGDAEVAWAGEQRGYGHVVVLQHPGGLITVYAHAQAVLVKEGDRVRAGDPIARVGEASRTSGPHIHFEVREKGVPTDPLPYLPPPE